MNISIVVPEERGPEAVQELHRCFFEGQCNVSAEDLWGLSAMNLDGKAL